MNNEKMVRRLLSLILVLTLALVSMANGVSMRVQAGASTNNLVSTYLNASEKYLYLGGQGSDTYDFNIKNSAIKKGASYYWYVKTDKGDPDSVTINNTTGAVTAKEVGTAYIRCKVTLSGGKILRPEAKVIVRNNITEVEISNISGNMTITAGIAKDFNRTIINTAAGKGENTQGITRWEIANDTAGAQSATTQGVVLPTQAGKFEIRAVCFQSNAKYQQWLADKEKYASYITAASKRVTIQVVSSNGTGTAATQDQLIKLLSADNITQITIATKKEIIFSIPEGDYSKKLLIVNIPNADLKNHGVFKEITINGIKDKSWEEYAKGNQFQLMDDQIRMVVDETSRIDEVTVDTLDAIENFEVEGEIIKITVRKRAQLNFSGNGSGIPVIVESGAAGSTIITSMPLDLDLKAKSDIILNAGSEDTTLDKSDNKADVKIVNNTTRDIIITTNGGEGETVGAGKTVVSDGNTTPTPPSSAAISTISNITGIAKVGVELTAGILTPSGATATYQWQICNTSVGTYTNIIGATTNKYTPTIDNVGKYIKVVVTGTGNYTGTVISAPTESVAPTKVTGTAIAGVTSPVLGATPVTTATETTEYTAIVTWNTNPVTFAAVTVYTATITLTPKTGYTLTGVTENQFTVAGATTVSNATNSGEITAVFPATSFAGDIVVSSHRWITVNGLTLGDVIKVYDTVDSPDLLGTGTVTVGDPTSVSFSLDADLPDGAGSIFITVTSSGQPESVRIEKNYGAAALVEDILATLTASGDIINLEFLPADATGLEAAVAIDGSSYAAYVPIAVDGIGKAVITALVGVSTNTKVKIRVAGSDTTVPGDDKEIMVYGVFDFDAATNAITNYYPNGEQNLVIPTTIGGVPVKTIKNQAIALSNELKTITIPAGIETLESQAILLCPNIETITIGKDVAYIGRDAVRESSSIIVDPENASFSSDNGVLFNKAKTTLETYPVRKADSSYSIPAGVEILADYTFMDTNYLETVTIPSSVTTIGVWAFGQSVKLTNIIIQDGVTTIGYWAFAFCNSLTTVTIPASVTSIGDNVLCYCNNLESAYFEGNAGTMGNGILYGAKTGFILYYHVGSTGFEDPWCSGLTKATY